MRGSTAGLGDDGLKGISSTHFTLLTILDHFISSTVITPLVVTYWRGTWCFMDLFVYSNALYKSALVSVLIGFIGSLIFTLEQNYFQQELNLNINKFKYYLGTRLYSACFCFVCVNQFRGTWLYLDLLTNIDLITVSAITLFTIIVLILTKTLRNLSAPPFAIALDRCEGYFLVPTFFKYSSDKVWLYLMDCVFSVCVIGTLVVFVWRGTWTLIDLLLFPGNPVKSAWASTIIGYSLVLLTFSLQPLMKHMARSLTGLYRLFVVDIYLLFSFCGTVNVWRGIWNLVNHYFLPGMPSASFILSHIGSFVILMLINSSNSILVRGVYLDGEEQGELCVDFPCYYVRLLLQARREKKLIKECSKKESRERRSSEVDSLIILAQDSGKPITIIPVSKNNNEVQQQQ